MTTTPRWKLNVNERGVKHFHNEIEVWDENDNAPEDIYTVCRQLQREHNAHAAMVEGIEKALSLVSQGGDDDERPAYEVVNEMVEVLQAALRLANEKGG